MEKWTKPYELRGVVEVARSRANFDTEARKKGQAPQAEPVPFFGSHECSRTEEKIFEQKVTKGRESQEVFGRSLSPALGASHSRLHFFVLSFFRVFVILLVISLSVNQR